MSGRFMSFQRDLVLENSIHAVQFQVLVSDKSCLLEINFSGTLKCILDIFQDGGVSENYLSGFIVCVFCFIENFYP